MIGLFRKNSNGKSKKLRDKKKELKKLAKAKKYDQVFKIGTEILETNPDDLDVLFILGGIYYMRGKYEKSIQYFEKVLSVSSYDLEALLLKGNALFNLKKFEEAKSCCNKIKEIDQKNQGVSDLLEKISKSINK